MSLYGGVGGVWLMLLLLLFLLLLLCCCCSCPSGLHVSHTVHRTSLSWSCLPLYVCMCSATTCDKKAATTTRRQQQQQQHRNNKNKTRTKTCDAGMLLRAERAVSERVCRLQRESILPESEPETAREGARILGVQLLTKLPRCSLCCGAVAALQQSVAA